MRADLHQEKVLVTVMTYPHPSTKYTEVICTAGVTEAGQWIRLYPIDYRYLPKEQQFRKYQWIEVRLHSDAAQNDQRKESRRPDLHSIRPLGAKLGTTDGWYERRQIIDRMPVHTLEQLKSLYERERVSLGIIRPASVQDLEIEEDDAEWDPKWLEMFRQTNLFCESPKDLRKIPFKFTYVFRCEDSERPHRARLIDWEMGTLWLKEAQRFQNEKRAAQSVRKKFLEEVCGPDKDTRFFMGTRHPFNVWMVLGVFWPPRVSQQRLF